MTRVSNMARPMSSPDLFAAADAGAARVLRVALDTPLRQLFDYLPPAGECHVGSRVWVPFGPRRLVGVVMGAAQESTLPPAKLRRVAEVIDPQPLFDPLLLAFLHW